MVAGAIGGHSDLGEGSGGRPHSVLGLRVGERLHVVWHDATSKWLYGVMEGGPALYSAGCHLELFGSPPILAKSILKSKLVPKVDTFCKYFFLLSSSIPRNIAHSAEHSPRVGLRDEEMFWSNAWMSKRNTQNP